MSTSPNRTEREPIREVVTHERIGEFRCALFDRGRIVDLRVERWSTHDSRARWGQRYASRVTALDQRLGGAFVDLGLGLPGFLPFGRDRDSRIREGAALIVRVVREAEAEKGPALTLEGEAGRGADVPALIADAAPWTGWPGEPREASPDEAERIDAAMQAALEPTAPIPGGGRLWIERTRALVAVDVDSAGREAGGTDPARFARALNLAAVPEIVRQVRVRGLAGLICVDFTGPRRKGDPEAVTKALASAFDAERNGGVDAPRTEVLPVSRLGIAEIARQKRRAGLSEICLGADGQPTPETVAIDGLDLLARALHTARGRIVRLSAPADALRWLEADPIGWRDALAEEVGGRHELAVLQAGRSRCVVDVL